MNEIQVKVCAGKEAELELLAKLNKQLIEDEKHDNPMNVAQLKDRMRAFISTDYRAYLFEANGETAGYALVNHSRQPLHVRQFFICRECRRNGYGRAAFEKLLEQLHTQHVDIEVMYGNEAGYAFWKSIGFVERSIYMRRGE
ncbi:GNAT family N-acetyltransferase [Paenibacillus chartarius]|uniref:GNAT family N-acetyltransferase n=1 Tax=Paenibacillus chartarius TaxID=747481 RepID=A0ABV6DNG3_9BACL